MRQEWRDYWKYTIKSFGSVFLALGVSFIIWLFQLPNLQPDDYLLSFYLCCMYGLVIYAYIWGLYALIWAVVTHFSIKADRLIKPNWSVHLSIGFFGMVMGLVTAKWLKAIILDQPFSLSGMTESLMIGSFITLMFMFYYSYKYSTEENVALKAAKAASELHVLKNQMQPHFLFNSLNSLSELIETKQDSASEMIMKLSDLYREILENSKRSVVYLDSEISIITKYLELERLRFGERLAFNIEVPENAKDILIPPLILQTLVENAVKHGISSSVEGGRVDVCIASNGSPGFNLSVRNTGGKISSSNGSQTGIENTRARLDLLYGDKHNFKLKNKDQFVEASFWFSGESVHA